MTRQNKKHTDKPPSPFERSKEQLRQSFKELRDSTLDRDHYVLETTNADGEHLKLFLASPRMLAIFYEDLMRYHEEKKETTSRVKKEKIKLNDFLGDLSIPFEEFHEVVLSASCFEYSQNTNIQNNLKEHLYNAEKNEMSLAEKARLTMGEPLSEKSILNALQDESERIFKMISYLKDSLGPLLHGKTRKIEIDPSFCVLECFRRRFDEDFKKKTSHMPQYNIL